MGKIRKSRGKTRLPRVPKDKQCAPRTHVMKLTLLDRENLPHDSPSREWKCEKCGFTTSVLEKVTSYKN